MTILQVVVENRSKPQGVQNNNPFCMFGWFLAFVFHLLYISFYIDQLTNPLHSGIMSRVQEHTNKLPHPTQVLRPWVYVGAVP